MLRILYNTLRTVQESMVLVGYKNTELCLDEINRTGNFSWFKHLTTKFELQIFNFRLDYKLYGNGCVSSSMILPEKLV